MYNINNPDSETLFADQMVLSNHDSYDNLDSIFTDELLATIDDIDSAKCNHIFDEDIF